MLWTYFKISILIGVFWGVVTYVLKPDYALFVGFVVFATALCGLSFNYGAKSDTH